MNYPKHKMLTAKELERLFDITKYDKAGELNVAGWARCFQFRYMIKRLADKKWDDELRRFLTLLLISPLPQGEIKGSIWGATGARSTVWDQTVLDAYFARKFLDCDRLRDAFEYCKEHDRILQTEVMPGPGEEILNTSLDELCRERGISVCGEQVVHVDLNATDEQLIEDFITWLKEKRQRTGRELKRNFTKKDFADWARFKVLAYIDLQLLCSFLNRRMSHATIGDLMFPDDEVDRAERVRKVVQPLAREIMNPHILDALDVQAGNAERKAEDSIPEQ